MLQLRACLRRTPPLSSCRTATATIRWAGTAARRPDDDDDQTRPSAISLLGLAQPEWRLLTGGLAALLAGTAAQIAIPIGFSAMVDSGTTGDLVRGLSSSSSSSSAAISAVPISDLFPLKHFHLTTTAVIVFFPPPPPNQFAHLSLPASMASLFVVNGLANAARIQCFTVASARLVVRLRQRLFDQILCQPMSFFDRHRSGGLVSRLSNDVHVMSDAISGETLSNGIRYSIQLVSTSAVMLYISPSLSSILLGIGPAIAGAGYFYGRHVKRISGQVQRSLELASATAEERFSAVRVVKAFTAEAAESRIYRQYVNDVYTNAVRYGRATSVFNLFTSMVGNASILSVLAYGSYLIGTGHLTAGQLTAFGLYTMYFGVSIVGLSRFWGDFMKGMGSSEQIWTLLGHSPGPSSSTTNNDKKVVPAAACRGHIELRNVTFRYPTRPGALILDQISVKFEPNTITALVGESGSGKSTLAWLLLKFYEAESGSISLDGADIADLDPTWLRQQISIVSQDPAIFHGSVAQNIQYGAPDAPLARIADAARTAQAHAFIERLPQRYDTIIGQNGLDLSGGQRQRLAIARAVLKNAPILIFDEATSALDAQNERLINDALESVLGSRTTILIAHRLSTIQKADVVGVLARGRLVEYGTHADLLQNKGAYHKLIQLQAI